MKCSKLFMTGVFLLLASCASYDNHAFIQDPEGDRAPASFRCERLFLNEAEWSQFEKKFPDKNRATPPKKLTPQESWNQSVQALKQINESIYGREHVIESLATAILAKEFVWMNGEPGGAKTLLSRIMFQSVLNSIPETEKKIFLLQFHKLISEGKISGFQKFSSMMEKGEYKIETSSSLVGDQFLFLIADEVEKSNPAVLNALLSVLNERKAFLGSKVVDSFLSSGVFTSNKTTGEFIQGFYTDRASGEALLDRLAIKIHISNQQLSAHETALMYDLVKNSQKLKLNLPLLELETLVSKVKISDEIMKEIVEIARTFDNYVTNKADQSRQAVRYGESDVEYFPVNQFSNRSVRRMVQVFKASLVAQQLMDGVRFENIRLQPQREDLALLARSALYVGPSQVKLKSFKVSEIVDHKISKNGVVITSDLGIKQTLQAEYSPFEGKLFLQDLEGQTQFIYKIKNESGQNKWILASQSSDFSEYKVDESNLNALNPYLNELLLIHKIDLKKPEFQADTQAIDALLAKGTVKDRTAQELNHIKQDLQQFADTLNQQFQKEKAGPAQVVNQTKLLLPRSEKEKREFRREILKLPHHEKISRYYDWMVYEVKALKQRFIELDYSIEAHLTGLLSDNHLYVFGPPGGAKTALAEVILKSELKKLNADQIDSFTQKLLLNKKTDQTFVKAVLERLKSEQPKQFERFLLQFHKLLPEGVLIGFPKIEKQLNEGVEEIETSTSLASEKFVFAILDEVDKANPQTIAALLSILNEREVFAGNTLIKTALRTAILTSNKMPSEFLEAYREDQTTGEAVLDRAPNKVYVSNKISSEEALTRFLTQIEKGISPNWKGLLAVGELKPILNQVKFESPAVKTALAEIQQQFLKLRIKKEQDSKVAHKMDAREFPDYYVSAAGSASDRTFIKLVDQFKARFIVNQLMEGVNFNELKTSIGLKDLNLFFEGLGYWAPQKILSSFNSNGQIEFKNDSTVIEKLVSDGIVDSRTKYHLLQMIDEAKDFSQVASSVVQKFTAEYKSQIAKYPDLFPGILTEKPDFNNKVQVNDLIQKSIENLSRLKLHLEKSKAQGLKNLELTALKSDYTKKELELKQFFKEHNLLSEAELADKMRTEIIRLQNDQAELSDQNEKQKAEEQKEKDKIREKEKEALKEVSQLFRPEYHQKNIVFHDIKPGQFKMGQAEVLTTITRPFSIQSAPVTQMQWSVIRVLQGERRPEKINPAHFKTGPDSQKVMINGIQVEMKPDHPIESVSDEHVFKFIAGLNKLSLSNDPGVQKILQQLIPGHKKGDIYDLPTEAQWEFTLRDRGRADKIFFDRDDKNELEKYAWYAKNSGNETHKVATKLPRIIDGQPFFDLEGNVGEWTKDLYDRNVYGGIDPQGALKSPNRTFKNGGYKDGADDLQSSKRDAYQIGDRVPNVGFRLVRTRP